MKERRRNERRRWGRKVTYPFIDSEGVLVTKSRRRKIDRRDKEAIEEELDIAPLTAAAKPRPPKNNTSIDISESKVMELEEALQDANEPASNIMTSIKKLENEILDATDKKESSSVILEVISTKNSPADKQAKPKKVPKPKVVPTELPELELEANETATGKSNGKGIAIELLIKGKKHVVTTNKDSCVIGRDPSCDIVIQNKFASRAHAKIILKNGKFLVEDNSFNGTYINFNNGQKIHVSKDEQTLMTSGVMSIGKPIDDESKSIIEFKIRQ
jgi:pSer/pThr/pTyr-binding forkhead associated (FHA) protein